MILSSGAQLGPYEIEAALGAGGMGEVYKARDTRLGRHVAVKILPPDFAADAERLRRFEREARAAAALSHPNIVAVYDVGAHAGVPYIVEELLDGESLRARLGEEALPVHEAVRIAVQVARGLAAAHAAHLVHRDLKPENIYLTRDGTAKILDFGLAKPVESNARNDAETVSAAPGGATAPGRVLGTIPYLAPEQARGHPVDARTDLFAFGVVLYEMLAGERPFRGETVADTVAAILRTDPRPLPTHVPPPVRQIVTQCLEKRPEDRFSTAHDVALALQAASSSGEGVAAGHATSGLRLRRRGLVAGLLAAAAIVGALVVWQPWRVASTPPARHTSGGRPPKLVVLPFENLGAPEDAYFAAGMSEEITSRLANVHGLGVISRTSAVGYDRRGKTLKQIGTDLGVEYVLEGSVRWEHGAGRESRVRITPQLIRVADDTHVWAERYDRVIGDVFAMQSEVAENAVRAMGIVLLPQERTGLNEVSTSDLQAYDLYLRGQDLERNVYSPSGNQQALDMYQAAVDRDPAFAQALAALAECHLSVYWFYVDRSQERLTKAKDAAERAVELRPDLAETHNALGWYFYQGLLDYSRALIEFSAAIKIKPSSADTLAAVGYVSRRQGRWNDAADALGRAAELDPRNAQLRFNTASTFGLARRYAEADRAYASASGLDPQSGDTYADRAFLHVAWHGNVERAQALLAEADSVLGVRDGGHLTQNVLRVALLRRDYEEALRRLDLLAPRVSQNHALLDNQWYYSPLPLLRGQVQILAGQPDLARRSFEAAAREIERKAKEDPTDSRFHSSLGLAYAGLGRHEPAVREALRGCELMPASTDAWRALRRIEDLAFVYTMVGRHDEAIVELDRVLAGSGEFTPHVLRLDPRWDPLRSHPQYEVLLTKHQVNQ